MSKLILRIKNFTNSLEIRVNEMLDGSNELIAHEYHSSVNSNKNFNLNIKR